MAFQGFPVEIWGTVSDWVMIVVTAGTGLFIILAFREQRKVTYLQQLKFIFDIKPIFEFTEDFTNTEFEKRTTCEIILVQNVALKLIIVNNDETYNEIFVNRKSDDVVALGRPYDIIRNQENKFIAAQIDIKLFFTDEIGNKYSQWIHGQWPDLVIDTPEMINENNEIIKFLPPKLKQFKVH